MKGRQETLRFRFQNQLAVYDGMRNIYYAYATIKCDEIEKLQAFHYNLTGAHYEVDVDVVF